MPLLAIDIVNEAVNVKQFFNVPKFELLYSGTEMNNVTSTSVESNKRLPSISSRFIRI